MTRVLDKQILIRDVLSTYRIDTVKDVLCKLGMKPHMHLVKISIFSLNHVIVRHTEIILTMTLFSEKMLIFSRWKCGFMPDLRKKS